MTDLESRVARLEAESDIRRLKARYLNACDAKDVDAIRACFTDDAVIDFPPIGEFGLDGLIDVFTQMAAATPITRRANTARPGAKAASFGAGMSGASKAF